MYEHTHTPCVFGGCVVLVQSNVLINNAEEQSAPDKNGDITNRSLGMILVSERVSERERVSE
jgi:hypothetical protein